MLRAIIIVDEGGDVLSSKMDKEFKKKKDLLPRALSATQSLMEKITERKVQEIETSKHRVYIVGETDPVKFSTILIADKDDESLPYAYFFSKLMKCTLFKEEEKTPPKLKDVKEKMDEIVSERFKLPELPKIGKVIEYLSVVFQEIKKNVDMKEVKSMEQQIRDWNKKERKEYERFIKKQSLEGKYTTKDVLEAFDEGEIKRAYLIASELKNRTKKERNTLLWIHLGLFMKDVFPPFPAPPLEIMRKALEEVPGELTLLCELADIHLKRKRSVNDGIEALTYLNKNWKRIVEAYKSYQKDPLLREILVIALLSTFTLFIIPTQVISKMKEALETEELSMEWLKALRAIKDLAEIASQSNVWERIQSFWDRLQRKINRAIKEKVQAQFREESEKMSAPQQLRLNMLQAGYYFLGLAGIHSSTLNLKDKRDITKKAKENLAKIIDTEPDLLPFWLPPLARLGYVDIETHLLNFLSKEEKKKKIPSILQKSKKEIREILRVRARKRMGALTGTILMIYLLRLLPTLLMEGENLSHLHELPPELIFLLRWVCRLDPSTLKKIEDILSPSLIRIAFPLAGLNLTSCIKDEETRKKLRKRGIDLFMRTEHYFYMRGALSWDTIRRVMGREAEAFPTFKEEKIRNRVRGNTAVLESIMDFGAWTDCEEALVAEKVGDSYRKALDLGLDSTFSGEMKKAYKIAMEKWKKASGNENKLREIKNKLQEAGK